MEIDFSFNKTVLELKLGVIQVRYKLVPKGLIWPYHFDSFKSQNYKSFFPKQPLIFPRQPFNEVVSAVPYWAISALFARAETFPEGPNEPQKLDYSLPKMALF